MHDNDLRSDIVGNQNVTTYMIGFGEDVAESKDFLDKVAAAGGSGQAYTQTDAAGLKATLEKILTEVQDAADTTFVAPTVSVNAFNRSQNLNELYMAVFAPSKNLHWHGNLKKYRLLNKMLYGASASAPAVDPKTGYFADGTQALNSPGVTDGPKTRIGGAAATLEDTTASPRKIYTYLESSNDLTASANLFQDSNAAITSAMLGAVDADDRTRIIQYARGHDLNDEDKSSDFHHRMGDPMHSRPAVLIHGGTETEPQGTVFVATNDGVLHAFDIANIPEPEIPASNLTPKATTERWAFIPKEFLLRQNQLFKDAPTTNRRYALDGDVKVLKFDIDGNGVIDGADRAFVFVGTGRGGYAYYALDVTNIEKPKFLWKVDNMSPGFANLGRTWSTPQIGRVKIGDGSGQNKQFFVLVFGGGYDTRNDIAPLRAEDFVYGEDSVGNSLYIVDAVSGKLLWSAGKSGTDYSFTNAKMTHSFPAPVTVLDTNQDRFLDRIYAADVDGKIWRFDINNGSAASALVTGGVLASIGNGALVAGSRSAANARRFYSQPDVASIVMRGSLPFYNIAIGSGYRGHPLNKDTQDRFYSIRDYEPHNVRAQSSYTDDAVITDSELVDVTDMTKNVTDKDPGWKINLNLPEWRGEKNLSEATTANEVILFTTFTPLGEDPNNPCLSRSLNRIWGVKVADGDPFIHWVDGETGSLKPESRYLDTNQNGISPRVQVLVDPQGGSMGICNSGSGTYKCVDVGRAVRTYWEHK
jgi:type IV pilus assembly protein PilY1